MIFQQIEEDTTPSKTFSYEEAFSRTLGWITREEQQVLRDKKVAICGLGGVGGAHAITLARLGVGAFQLADFDHFDLANFNRQFCATMSNLGRPKQQVIAEHLLDINPEIKIESWDQAITSDTVSKFLDGADIYVDSIDFFALEVRRALFAEARRRGIPAITAAPVGTGCAWLIFTPQSQSFEEYFGFSEHNDDDDYIRFLLGLSPKGLHRSFLVDPSFIDFKAQKAPSTPMGITLCAGIAGTEVLKLLLHRGGTKAAPWFHQFDASSGKCVSGRSWFGPHSIIHRYKLRHIRRTVENTNAE
ncbi:ThiF family adenylyltransferase [Phaeobacter porticola]|uniref:Putative adenylyltransferase ThiF n=1 Tax=Phaeobacter porticola TaxID=1844006 RepID=A0A1L3I7P5_9RHOB|nr:ThiF family adenylyltransferase [Phaeobacter porticola]APG48189.1 putative adenylyltransferase ThiF [Phaeobacter porticola]